MTCVSTVAAVLIASLALVSTAPANDVSAPNMAALQAANPRESVQHLYEECTGSSNLYEKEDCVQYISGVADSMTIFGATNSSDGKMFGICSETAVSYGAYVQAFINWAEKHPESWGLRRWIGASMGLRATWPCK
jgi:hypothetical protein